MAKALQLAALPKGQTRPNPMVGCVIVKENTIIGEGYHHRAGLPHAEREALAACTADPQGATAYVTLEPCNHQGKTPPCTEALITSGVARVVVAQLDPNPQARGGVERLQRAGIDCEIGLLQRQAQLLNASFNLFHRHKTPLVTLKWASTLDGCTSTTTGSSKWITGTAARELVHEQRAAHDCIVVGLGTALADSASLTVRDVELIAPAPMRIVFDSHLQIPPNHPMIEADPSTAVICGLPSANSAARRGLESAGAQVVLLPANQQGQICPKAFLAWCTKNKLQSVYVEGGRNLAGSFWSQGLVHRIHSFISPSIVGFTEKGLSPLKLLDPITQMNEKHLLDEIEITPVGRDVLISGWTPQALSMIVNSASDSPE